jgi:hypothetical protein
LHLDTRLFSRDGLDHLEQFFFDVENGAVAGEGVVPEVLDEELWNDVEVFFIIVEDVLY